jgi:hypothetical protein
LFFVSISVCIPGSVTLRQSALFAFMALAGLCSSASAQTAPQLLPYTSKLIAGSGTTAIGSGATCPVSGFKSTDAYGDGCLATEVQLVSPRYAIADKNGNIFFSDYNNGLVRRVDAVSGVVTAVAGGASSSPASGTACGSNTSTDIRGDGCLSTLVKLSHPSGLALSPSGDLYFSDIGYANVRKVAATSGLITTGGIISLVAGNVSGTFGYASGVTAATGSYLQDPYGISFDAAGNLYIADEYTKAEAVLVVNTNATGSTTVTGVTIPAGQIVKIAGSTGGGATTCPNSPASTNGCTFGNYTNGAVANASQLDGPWAAAADPAGNVYVANEFNSNGIMITPAGVINTYGGIQGTAAKVLKRGPQGSFGIGSVFGVTADANSNVYFTDASSGVVWRIDGAGQSMYVVAGGAATTCAAATDSYGDGCPATQATFGKSGTGNFATTTLPGPGIYGITEDAYNNLFVGDTETSLIREIASGTQFGNVGANDPTQIVDIHFAAGDGPAAASPYTITAGGSNFSLGAANCTANTDNTRDCLLPVTATPSVLGAFTGTLQVQSSLGATATFPLGGNYVNTPFTRTSVAVSSNSSSCAATTVYSPTTPLTLTASVFSSGSPTGTVTFYANGTQIGTPQTVSNSTASLTYTFSTVNTYTITATYNGDSYFKTSSGTAPSIVTISNPTFTTSNTGFQQSTVAAGQTGLYSFQLVQNVYAGTITMACSGLPAHSSCSFSPSSISANGCSTTNTVALSILTQQASPAVASLGTGGRGLWATLSVIPGLGLALLIGLRRRRIPMRYGQLWMALALLVAASGMIACNNAQSVAATPSGNYNITVTATGSSGGTVATFTVPLTVQ